MVWRENEPLVNLLSPPSRIETLIADADQEGVHDMFHSKADNTVTVRSVFVIDPQKKVHLRIAHPASTGRERFAPAHGQIQRCHTGQLEE
jgi:hypothetical protein